MMFWNEDTEDKSRFEVPDEIVDVVYAISNCKSIPIEHAHALSVALYQALPWLAEEELAGVHQIYGAESGNGWERPSGDILYLSRRQKMTLRLPKRRLENARQLTGQALNIDGHELTVGSFNIKLLSDLSTLFARHVICEQTLDENQFLADIQRQLKDMGIEVKKMMCSKERTINTPDVSLLTRGLMIADLKPEDSVKLQQLGLGPGRKLGCGLFIPQKGIKAVTPD